MTVPSLSNVKHILWLTDIHFNFLTRSQITDFLSRLREMEADVVLIGGDIGEAGSVVDYLKRISDYLGVPVCFVLGNHDYYSGSLTETRIRIKTATEIHTNLIHLREIPYLHLNQEYALLGCTGWYDGGYGSFYLSNVRLNDFKLISELTGLDFHSLLTRIRLLAEEDAEHLKSALTEAFKTCRHALILLHVPPFMEACWHHGGLSDENWLPFFSSKLMGDMLKEVLLQHSDRSAIVLCGHTHSSGTVEILPNLKVKTGSAEYGQTEIQEMFELDTLFKDR